MYFPYLRGRQYELLALRELVQGDLLGNRVIPIVEPIKFSSTFSATIKLFAEKTQALALILNPAVGELANGAAVEKIIPYIDYSILPSVIMGSGAKEALDALVGKDIPVSDVVAIMTNRDYLELYKAKFTDNSSKFTLIPDERQIRRNIDENKVMFADNFIKQEKNADYLKQEDEFFTDDHLHFSEEGFIGFGDYSIVGKGYDESGFTPWAVAIHVVYFANDDTLRIHHFVSDSNGGTEDVAGKFYEAVIKLKQWYDAGQSRQRTTALSTLLSHANNGYYPGLPTIKKLSIMHHLELVGRYLDGSLGK